MTYPKSIQEEAARRFKKAYGKTIIEPVPATFNAMCKLLLDISNASKAGDTSAFEFEDDPNDALLWARAEYARNYPSLTESALSGYSDNYGIIKSYVRAYEAGQRGEKA